jgi:hypothetical protein
MTEAEWRASEDPKPMLELIGPTATDRQLRLFACACCRRIWPLYIDQFYRRAIERSEAFADGTISRGALINALRDTYFAERGNDRAALLACNAADCAASPIPTEQNRLDVDGEYVYIDGYLDLARETGIYAALASAEALATGTSIRPERAAQAVLLRDIAPRPFSSSLPIDRRWLTWNDNTVHRIARAIYDERAFDRMPILADALEDAGCDDADILRHCREPGEHVRGCWVIDLLLGKE